MTFPGLRLFSDSLFRVDPLSWTMAALITFVIVTVLGYSRRYMAGDSNYARYRLAATALGLSVLVMVLADNLWVMLTGWGLSNLLLVRLMVHKPKWQAARNAGLLALRNFSVGFAMFAVAICLLSSEAHSPSLTIILAHHQELGGYRVNLALLLVALTAMTQSALWPFHRWLLSSLNSPTPVSALMHAGLVNGGGFLLVRFAPLYLTRPGFLYALFVMGLVTAVVGTYYKLLQTDIKRMLACSTMGQMGFMVMQCGMGLFAPAVSHLCWHGLFKAYLFLSAGSVVEEKRRKHPFSDISLFAFTIACVFGFAGAYTFALTSGNALRPSDTSIVLIGLAFMAATQLSCGILDGNSLPGKALLSLAVSVLTGLMYGSSLRLVEHILAPMGLLRPQPLNGIYLAGFAAMTLIWLAMNMNIMIRLQNTSLWKRLYMAGLNGAQPHPSTITVNRTTYSV
jgi:NAD(P)H-quinone oxidoreductase subunit 5